LKGTVIAVVRISKPDMVDRYYALGCSDVDKSFSVTALF